MNTLIYNITENFNFNNLKIENPSLINANNYFSKIYNNNSNLLELNSNNYNVFEVQNTFKSGDPAIISISNLSLVASLRVSESNDLDLTLTSLNISLGDTYALNLRSFLLTLQSNLPNKSSLKELKI